MYQKRIVAASKKDTDSGQELINELKKDRDKLLEGVSSGISEEQIKEKIKKDKELYRDR